MADRRVSYQLPSIDNQIDENTNFAEANNHQNTPSPSSADYAAVIDSTLGSAAALSESHHNNNTNNNNHHPTSSNLPHVLTKGGGSRVTKVDQDRKHLHIRSEQRRRERITDGFSQLRAVVPTVRSGYDSKALVLKKSAEYIEALEYEVSNLKNQLIALEQFYKNNGNSNNNNDNVNNDNNEFNDNREKKDGEKVSNEDTKSESKDKNNSDDNNSNNNGHGNMQMMFHPPFLPPHPHPPFVPAGFMPPMFPFMSPIIGTPIGPNNPGNPDQNNHNGTMGQPATLTAAQTQQITNQASVAAAAALMQPTVPYYFATDFTSKRNQKPDDKKEDNAATKETAANDSDKEKSSGSDNTGDDRKVKPETSNEVEMNVVDAVNAFAVAVATNKLKEAVERVNSNNQEA
ncbi:hypothetical protein DASC09_032500 [Saccharomycopsis crataegensis]|uniref:BHLH domain-containing protein n=1 Tax=Saccharomycopsis crataegensis TaxID=43959 RepID=A0AAV5QN18_9ASCO|nr:hypothetical protein DASC09_032500 [Saccharomycopsis crataegensis]